MRPLTVPLAVLGVFLHTAAFAQTAGLKIVVVEGEGAVNIIQQKTAVAPIVEVRDHNNLPVPGAVVTFSLGGPGASFGGASTLAVTTNAAGQAAAAGFTPTAAGAIQINATAVFQGQSAVAAITQTNVMTAAQAAAASGASGAGGAGSAGGAGVGAGAGGISATTIGIVGGVAAAGAVAAVEVKNNAGGAGERHFTGPLTGQLTQTFAGGANPGCTIIRTITSTLTADINDKDGSVQGKFFANGTDNITGGTCAGTFNAPFGFTIDIAAGSTASNITARTENSGPSAGATNSTTTTIFTIQASLSGSTMTGSVGFEQNTVATSPTPATITGKTTMPFTLTEGAK